MIGKVNKTPCCGLDFLQISGGLAWPGFSLIGEDLNSWIRSRTGKSVVVITRWCEEELEAKLGEAKFTYIATFPSLETGDPLKLWLRKAY